jgi:flagellar export protein FliJ
LKPFRFRLESVLRHHGRKKDQARTDRALALAHLYALESESEGLAQTQSKDRDRVARSARWRAQDLQQAGARAAWLHEQTTRLKQRIREASLLLQEKDRLLRLAMREERKFELLRERRKATWAQEQEKLLQKELDELAGRGPGRGSICPAGRQS